MVSARSGKVDEFLANVEETLRAERAWVELVGRRKNFSIHLAVMVEPYLAYVLAGRKTIESRFSVNRSAPFGRVQRGDLILFKKSGGPVAGVGSAREVRSYSLDDSAWREIRTFEEALCVDAEFWRRKEGASYATLIELARVRTLPPIGLCKRDRRGWVVLREAQA